MKNRLPHSTILAVAMLAALAVPLATATAEGSAKPYNPPRTADGKPDLQGIWEAENEAAADVQPHAAQLGIPAGLGVVEGGAIPYQPAALAQRQRNFENRAKADPLSKCFLPGVPRITYIHFPFQIFQTPNYIAMVSEYAHTFRTIYMNGTKHPEDIDFWMGDSRGHWEGDTLVVDVSDFNDQTWFDKAGDFHSAALHVVERYTRTGPDTLAYEVTIEDPKTFTRPWKMSMPLYRHTEKNFQILEYECYAYADPLMKDSKDSK